MASPKPSTPLGEEFTDERLIETVERLRDEPAEGSSPV